jgi:hypothetical protein
MKRLLFALLLVAGCAAPPPSGGPFDAGAFDPSSFTAADSLGLAYATVEGLAKATETLCAAATIGGECTGTISTSSRDAARASLTTALVILDHARAIQATDQPGAMRLLADAEAIFTIVAEILEPTP